MPAIFTGNITVVSLHHTSGERAENAHKYVLPLCKWHHQYAAPAECPENNIPAGPCSC
uniref:Ref family recombination enhancement nuclease n=1 Tax=Salmonella sp. TaxID=599 RepID=UPI0039929942